MFKIIEPKYHCLSMPSINHFTELIKPQKSFGLSKQDQNGATFVLCDDRKNGAWGGALLLKKSIDEFPYEVVNALSGFVPRKEGIWKCVVSLVFEKESPLSTTNEGDHFCQIFYRNLYNNLVEFGKKQGTGFLCVSLDFGEYLCTEGLIFWPYVFKITPQQSADGLFHGILSLTGSQYEDYQKNWKVSLSTQQFL